MAEPTDGNIATPLVVGCKEKVGENRLRLMNKHLDVDAEFEISYFIIDKMAKFVNIVSTIHDHTEHQLFLVLFC